VSASAALDLLDEFTPDFIFIDMNMPKVNGLECIALLNETNKALGIPLFMYSTSGDPVMQRKAVSLGASGCYKKSGNPNSLVDIEGILRQILLTNGKNNKMPNSFRRTFYSHCPPMQGHDFFADGEPDSRSLIFFVVDAVEHFKDFVGFFLIKPDSVVNK
jgi:CheY-like chemotaxis protein